MTHTHIRWGILGTGRIAGLFAEGLAALPDAQLVAVGSRTETAADMFADRYNIPHRHGSYEALAADPDVDVVYVATPHTFHKENSLLCLDNGKAVLCEKPFMINAREAEEVVNRARQRGLFLMEAMWTRFLPLIIRIREVIASGAIGDPLMVTSDFGFRTSVNPHSRLFEPALGGGGLLDVGVYAVSMVSMILGEPERVASLANLGETGVDEQGAAILGYSNNRMAIIWTAIRTRTPHETTIMGSQGLIRIHSPSWMPNQMTISISGQPDQTVELPFEGNGYNYEAAEVGRCLRTGQLESPFMPLDETLAIMRTMDSIREHWGLRYPME